MTPTDPQAGAVTPPAPEAPAPALPVYRWYHKMCAILFATFCLEVGFFLLCFPWTSYAADFAAFRPGWRAYWDNPFIRGGISGLGVINLYISLIEILRLRRFAKR